MAAVYGNGGDSYGGTLAWSPEEVNITSQPQSLDVKNPDSNPAGCQHVKKIPFTTVTHDGTGHLASAPLDCYQCGQDVAAILFTQLSLGVPTDFQSKSPLQFRDVIVLTPDARISDVSGMVQGLRDASIPVRVVGEEEADVIRNAAYVDEVAVAWQGLAGSDIARRVMVLMQRGRSEPNPTLQNFGAAVRPAEHVIWVRHPLANSADDVTFDVEDGVALEAVNLLGSERGAAFDDKHPAVDEEKDIVGEEKDLHLGVTDQHLRDNAPAIRAVTHAPYYQHYHPAPGLSNGNNNNNKGRFRGVDTGYNRNDCCDNFCLACSHDVGESGCILCCPCCGELGTWCENCCRGFGESLNGCVAALFCCDCSSGSGGHHHGCGGDSCDCGDCDCDCGDCNCDCGDCNCDCGSCDCTIM